MEPAWAAWWVEEPRLAVQLGPLRLKNPVMTASGTFGYGLEFEPYLDLGQLGAIVVKGLSLQPRLGNPTPRIAETPAGMLNSIGLQNVGIEAFISEKLPRLREIGTPVIANIFGETIEEYCAVARRAEESGGVAAVEANISCPNVSKGLDFALDPKATLEITRALRKATTLPLLIKLSPNVTDIRVIARAAADGGADALSVMNTVLGMAVDVRTRKPRLATATGGLSGPAVRPIALRALWQVRQAVKLPLIGIGGIMTAEDALEFLIVGATAIQVGTANFVDPQSSVKILDGLRAYCRENDVADVNSLVDTLQFPG
ncbi:MAG: dihydroorotate dehydrogenase [Candidatus Tectomicrobia bacterium]|uniref:Dihydroorotate dehydrogenase n=1 Tax=Tectimicrobiota bacterium TaxID=2528274 RepID=A0A932M1I6_UNCTE|nr:dihydroorotate dehydrogenase [Candidatus Tectomicrobia bacterium]